VGGRAVSPARRHGTRLLAAQRARGNARAGAWVCPRPGPVAARGWLAQSRFAWAAGFGWFFLFPSDFLPSRPVQPRFTYLGHDVEITFNRTEPNLQSTRRTQPATLLPLQHTMRGPHHHSPHPSLQPPASLSSPSPPPSDPQESGGGGGGGGPGGQAVTSLGELARAVACSAAATPTSSPRGARRRRPRRASLREELRRAANLPGTSTRGGIDSARFFFCVFYAKLFSVFRNFLQIFLKTLRPTFLINFCLSFFKNLGAYIFFFKIFLKIYF
jgi:hypothetical protein